MFTLTFAKKRLIGTLSRVSIKLAATATKQKLMNIYFVVASTRVCSTSLCWGVICWLMHDSTRAWIISYYRDWRLLLRYYGIFLSHVEEPYISMKYYYKHKYNDKQLKRFTKIITIWFNRTAYVYTFLLFIPKFILSHFHILKIFIISTINMFFISYMHK
jgi:hypothetical protein